MHVSTCNSLKTLFTTADSNFSERITLTMDERHWWIAGKIQESLKVGGFDNPTLIEDFMCKPETLDMINEFLQPGGPCRLFFFCDTSESIASSNLRGLKLTGNLSSLKLLNLEDIIVLYLLRNNIGSEVDPSHIERDIYCGELKGNTLDMLHSVLNEIFVPLIKAQKDWGSCLTDNQNFFRHNMEKIMTGISEISSGGHGARHVVRERFEHFVSIDGLKIHTCNQKLFVRFFRVRKGKNSRWGRQFSGILPKNVSKN